MHTARTVGKVRSVVGVSTLLLMTSAALAAQPAYLDDRSTAASLVKSFYNAINRHEYARAYTYFGPDGGPQPFARFEDGYRDTVFVRVVTGPAQSDGAAGSVYYTLPVAIDALEANGSHRQFAGCYTTKLVNPTVQEPPVQPMYIFKATLEAAHGSPAALLPHCSGN